MSRRTFIFLACCIGALVTLVGGFFGYVSYVEQLRIADATPAFEPIAHLGCEFFSQPLPFHRNCRYVLEFSSTSRLTDESIGDLNSLRSLPHGNTLELFVATNRVTDDSLDVLKNIENLDVLDVTRSGISDHGISELKAALPRCDVTDRR